MLMYCFHCSNEACFCIIFIILLTLNASVSSQQHYLSCLQQACYLSNYSGIYQHNLEIKMHTQLLFSAVRPAGPT